MQTDISHRINQVQGDAKRRWNQLTEQDLDQVKEDVGALSNVVMERYGYTKDQAEQEVRHFLDTHDSRAMQIARQLPGNVNHGIRRHPWAAVATAAGLGMAVGLILRAGSSDDHSA
jgi:ElaB/YqjD/DUF883 family membrane-anchored ribosome-binding protein